MRSTPFDDYYLFSTSAVVNKQTERYKNRKKKVCTTNDASFTMIKWLYNDVTNGRAGRATGKPAGGSYQRKGVEWSLGGTNAGSSSSAGPSHACFRFKLSNLNACALKNSNNS